ncbi:MAG: radical SAM protein [Candidatus Bathyarchaeota archaeon]
MLLTPFDPWKSTLCTCPSKLTFNPYTGCDHRCTYCYASSYIPRFFDCRPKKNLLNRLKKEASKLHKELISISNSSDPYPQLEKKLELTRNCLKILQQNMCRIQIITKSDLVIRDIEILKDSPCVISITILTINDKLSKKLEPGAPTSSKRLKAIEILTEERIPTTVRIDPLIPFVNDDLAELVETIASFGVQHITSSTYKIKPDNWRRFSNSFPEVAERLKEMYFTNGNRVGRSLYLPRDIRFNLMKKVKQLAEKHDLKFGSCRERLQLNSATCDGSEVINIHKQKVGLLDSNNF